MRVLWQKDDQRIIEVADDCFDIDDLKGESYVPALNPDIPPETLRKQELDFEREIHYLGVFGYILEHWDPRVGAGWEEIDSCWGFVGQHDPSQEEFNHYIVEELKNRALEGGK